MTTITENIPAARATTSPGGRGQYIQVIPEGAWISTESSEDLTLEREEAAFIRLRPTLAHLQGQFVAISKGQVADYHTSKNVLIQRFIASHPDTTVYIDFVGEFPPARVRLSLPRQ